MTQSSTVAIAVALGLWLGLGAMAGNATAMDQYRWSKRPVVVFAPSGDDPRLVRQRALLQQSGRGLAERDVAVITVVGARVSTDLGRGPGMGADALRRRFGVPADAFRAILVGKDGGAKLSSREPIPARALFGTIDAMPMRADEMRRR